MIPPLPTSWPSDLHRFTGQIAMAPKTVAACTLDENTLKKWIKDIQDPNSNKDYQLDDEQEVCLHYFDFFKQLVQSTDRVNGKIIKKTLKEVWDTKDKTAADFASAVVRVHGWLKHKRNKTLKNSETKMHPSWPLKFFQGW